MKASFYCPAITLFKEDGSPDLESQDKLFDNLIEKDIGSITIG